MLPLCCPAGKPDLGSVQQHSLLCCRMRIAVPSVSQQQRGVSELWCGSGISTVERLGKDRSSQQQGALAGLCGRNRHSPRLPTSFPLQELQYKATRI